MSAPRVLLVEDEAGLVLALGDRLRDAGYTMESAGDGAIGLELAASGGYDLILLDLMLPALDGFALLSRLRRRGVATPVLILTARDAVDDKVRGLRLGGDDYLTKPFAAEELVARCAALLRRTGGRGPLRPGLQRIGDAEVDLDRSEVRCDGAIHPLSAKELALLTYLLEHRGVALARQELLDRVWGYDPGASTRTLDVHVVSLRKKLERHPSRPRWLQTVHRLGYRLAAP